MPRLLAALVNGTDVDFMRQNLVSRIYLTVNQIRAIKLCETCLSAFPANQVLQPAFCPFFVFIFLQIPLPECPLTWTFRFSYLQIPSPATPFVSHRSESPGCFGVSIVLLCGRAIP